MNIEERSEKIPLVGCWLWTGPITKQGYGQASKNRAHRLSWITYKGTIPYGLYVLHRCDVKSCVNPDHLFLGTHKDNMRDMAVKGRAAHPVGLQNGRAKLSEDDVTEILKCRASGVSGRSLARKYGVWDTTIGDIVSGKAWPHLTRDTAPKEPTKGKAPHDDLDEGASEDIGW